MDGSALARDARPPSAVRLKSAFAGALAHSLPAYSEDDRRALALLLLPFLIVATALAANHGWRRTHALLPEIATPAPVAPPPAVRPAPEVREIREVALAPLPLTYPPPRPMLDRWPQVELPRAAFADAAVWPPQMPTLDGRRAGTLDAGPIEAGRADVDGRLLAMLSPGGLAWPPALPQWLHPDSAHPSEGSVCVPDSQVRVAAWSPRTSRAALGPTVGTGQGEGQFGARLARVAREQTRDLVVYSARYQAIAYPLGDVNGLYGACTDVIIRAYRAVGVDLQQLVQQAHVGSGDRNIDHRRTETLRRFFLRQGASLPVTPFPEDYKPGDIVTYHRPFSRVLSSHIAIVSDVLAATGRPMIVHNRGWGPQLEDALFVDRITGHYRFNPDTARALAGRSLALKRGGVVRTAASPALDPSP